VPSWQNITFRRRLNHQIIKSTHQQINPSTHHHIITSTNQPFFTQPTIQNRIFDPTLKKTCNFVCAELNVEHEAI